MTKRLVIITGGTRGIGAVVSNVFRKAGYEVAATYHNNKSAANEFSARTGVPVFNFDVSDGAACKIGVAEIESYFEKPVDILINNAGITRDGTFHKMGRENWNVVIDTNLHSLFNMTSLVINSMRDRGFGRIINVSSINAWGQFGQANYSTSKAGILGFTISLAQESASKGITVNAVAPGYTDTEMVRTVPEKILTQIIEAIPSKRLNEPEEIARLILFLASDSTNINGQTYIVNGGEYSVVRPVTEKFEFPQNRPSI